MAVCSSYDILAKWEKCILDNYIIFLLIGQVINLPSQHFLLKEVKGGEEWVKRQKVSSPL